MRAPLEWQIRSIQDLLISSSLPSLRYSLVVLPHCLPNFHFPHLLHLHARRVPTSESTMCRLVMSSQPKGPFPASKSHLVGLPDNCAPLARKLFLRSTFASSPTESATGASDQK